MFDSTDDLARRVLRDLKQLQKEEKMLYLFEAFEGGFNTARFEEKGSHITSIGPDCTLKFDGYEQKITYFSFRKHFSLRVTKHMTRLCMHKDHLSKYKEAFQSSELGKIMYDQLESDLESLPEIKSCFEKKGADYLSLSSNQFCVSYETNLEEAIKLIQHVHLKRKE